MLAILGFLIMGLVIGLLARLLLPGRDPMSIGATLLLGVVGSILGGVIGKYVFGSDGGGFLLALVTTIVLLLVLRRTTSRGTV